MYEKLGDLLNDALDKGKFPAEEKVLNSESENLTFQQNESNTKVEEPASHINIEQLATKKTLKTGIIIRREQLQLPEPILQALNILELTPPVSWFKIKMQYRKMLKKNHPDTALQNQSYKSIDQIKQSFNILKEYYTSHSSNLR